MYAPLALKSVYDKRVSSRHLLTFLRAPVSIVNPTTTGTPLQRDLKLWAPGTCEYIGGQPTFKTEFIDKWNLKKLVTRLF